MEGLGLETQMRKGNIKLINHDKESNHRMYTKANDNNDDDTLGVLSYPLRLRNPFESDDEDNDGSLTSKLASAGGDDWRVVVRDAEALIDNDDDDDDFILRALPPDSDGDVDDDDCPTPPYVPCRYRFGVAAPAFELELC
ncbi:uncharacterized protein TEOVI_000095000 [Trypanosoma equiperdum]|uniref:Uncharacterized protein n=1 Tax=Trypanosoma equiperdum TaxID=5694 RepID=A0A1G4IBR1_TRYEQ|nr:hypothetical protein TEOVI_000095000 [Trypanosoma equiperdum]